MLKKLVKYWLPVLVWALLIFTFSSHQSIKTSQIHWQDFIIKKSAHMAEYCIFAILIYRALRNSINIKLLNSGIITVVSCFLYALSDEIHQSFTPGREPTVRDVAIDTVSAFLTIYLILNYLPKIKGLINEWAKILEIVP